MEPQPGSKQWKRPGQPGAFLQTTPPHTPCRHPSPHRSLLTGSPERGTEIKPGFLISIRVGCKHQPVSAQITTLTARDPPNAPFPKGDFRTPTWKVWTEVIFFARGTKQGESGVCASSYPIEFHLSPWSGPVCLDGQFPVGPSRPPGYWLMRGQVSRGRAPGRPQGGVRLRGEGTEGPATGPTLAGTLEMCVLGGSQAPSSELEGMQDTRTRPHVLTTPWASALRCPCPLHTTDTSLLPPIRLPTGGAGS